VADMQLKHLLRSCVVGALSMGATTSANAWEFSPSPICTLTHSEQDIDLVLTFDPSIPEYAITVTRQMGWPDGPFYVLGFDGPRPARLTSDRHTLSADRKSVTVRDSGFGNVLDGLANNVIAISSLGGQSATFDLSGAAPAVASFRDCPAPLSS